ncbi:MAG: redoxin domain-containing protein [Candidatus Aminicenantaceae bacterium]
MKYIKVMFAIVLIVLSTGCGKIPSESQVVFTPNQPVSGETVQVDFIPGKDSPLFKEDAVTMYAQFYPVSKSDDVVLQEVAMDKKGKKWKGEIVIDGSDVGCVLFQFVSGEDIDSNDGKCWDFIVYNEKGDPVKGAYTALSHTYSNSFYMDRIQDTGKALGYLKKEVELHAGNWRAISESWNFRIRRFSGDQQILKTIDEEVEFLLGKYPEEAELLSNAYSYYSRVGNENKSKKIIEKMNNLDPDHSIILSAKWREIDQLSDPYEKIKKALKFYQKIKDKDYKDFIDFINSWLVKILIKEKRFNRAVEFVNNIQKPAPNVLNAVSWSLSQEGVMLKEAEKFAAESLELIKAKDIKDKPLYMPEKRWLENQKNSLGKGQDIYGSIQYKLGKTDEAESSFRKAYENSGGKNPEITSHYVQCLLDNDKLDKAISVARKAVEENNSTSEILNLLHTAYEKQKGSTEKAEELITQAKNKAFQNKKSEIAKNFIRDAQNAPDFSLVDINGKNVSLQSLRGKTVIIDFWATWCRPCLASFPYLQKFWKKHKNDSDVMVLAINCWEKPKGEERMKLVRKFMDDSNYNFPVLIDENDKVVTSFKVEGIPTKFFVGPDGKIYFKDVGFHGPEMIEKMEVELDMIRNVVK